MVQPSKRVALEDRLNPVRRENLNEKIVSQIRQLIFSGAIKAGGRLPSERALTERFQVSRAVVRQALKALEQSGLVEIRTGVSGGAFVIDKLYMPVFQATYDLFNSGQLTLAHFSEARKAIESSSMRLAVQKATTEDIEKLRAINRKFLEDLSEPADLRVDKMRNGNNAFHLTIAGISGNPLMRLIVQSLLDLLSVIYLKKSRMTSYKFMKDTYERHEAIIQAMEDRDPKRSEELIALDTDFTRSLVAVSKKHLKHV
ncbi:MAG: FadR/GntR family transcriptional regulator [Syntrophorhabdales bacterium]|jgi:DNA-binding FadR family transcriptional regulator